jgi:hypothetical protein
MAQMMNASQVVTQASSTKMEFALLVAQIVMYVLMRTHAQPVLLLTV